MRDVLDRSAGERLSQAEYKADFRGRFWSIREGDFWKLERRQSFVEAGDDSWEAFTRGDWDLALRLIAGRRASFEEDARRMRDIGLTSYRVRVVVRPFTPYLQWELHALRLMGDASDRIRVVDVQDVRPYEVDGALPELVTVGLGLTYEVLYDDDGVPDGAIRWADAGITSTCRAFIRSLYESGEDVVSYADREAVPLPPPRHDGQRPR